MRMAVTAGVLMVAAVFASGIVGAQDVAIKHVSGESVVPFYEGWYYESDGSVRLSFGYLNFNYSEEVDIPIGPENRIEPMPEDQGQPSHFLPRRQIGVFTIKLPKGTKTEYRWTVNFRGKATSIPASLEPLYEIYGLKMTGQRSFANNGIPPDNTPPVLKFAADAEGGMGPGGTHVSKTTTVSRPLSIDVWSTDDGLPTRGNKPAGTTLTWSKFRGPGTITFTPPTARIESRSGKATTSVTFSMPGEYMLRLLATDGSGFSEQCCWTNGYVSVSVRSDGQLP